MPSQKKATSKNIKIEPLDDPIYEGLRNQDSSDYAKETGESEVLALKPAKSKEATIVDEQPDNNEVNKVDQDLWEKLKLPKLPCRLGGRLTSINTAEEWFNLVTSPEAQDRVYIYLYRVWPKIVRPKQSRNIEKVPLRMYSFNKFISNHGGGDYKMMVTDTSNPHSSLFEVLFTIDSQLYDPILNYAELDLAAKENKAYVEALKNKGLLSSEGKQMSNVPSQNNPAQQTNTSTNDKVTEVLGDVVKELLKSAQEKPHIQPVSNDPSLSAISNLLIEKMRQDDPNKGLAGIADLIKALKPTEQVNSGQQQVMAMVMDEVKSLRESNLQLTNRLLELNTTKSQSDNSIDQIDKVLNVVDKIRHRNEDESVNQPKMSLVERLIDKAVPLLGPVLQGLALKGLGANLNTSDLSNLNQSVNNSNFTSPEIGNVETPMSNSNPIPIEQPSNNTQLTQLVIAYGSMIADKIVSGTTGWEFAVDLDNLFGPAIWQQVVQFPPSQLLEAFKSVPQFWNRVAFKTEPYIANWIIEFIEYKRYIVDSDENEQEMVEENSQPKFTQ